MALNKFFGSSDNGVYYVNVVADGTNGTTTSNYSTTVSLGTDFGDRYIYGFFYGSAGTGARSHTDQKLNNLSGTTLTGSFQIYSGSLDWHHMQIRYWTPSQIGGLTSTTLNMRSNDNQRGRGWLLVALRHPPNVSRASRTTGADNVATATLTGVTPYGGGITIYYGVVASEPNINEIYTGATERESSVVLPLGDNRVKHSLAWNGPIVTGNNPSSTVSLTSVNPDTAGLMEVRIGYP